MDTLVTLGALLVVIAVKLVFFYAYTKHASTKVAKKAEKFSVVQKGPEPADKKATRRILVTGGCGFLGSAIVRQLHDRLGDRVSIVVLDLDINTKCGPLLPSATYYRGDVCSYAHVRAAAAGCACVVHNAALLEDCLTREETVTRVIEKGTRNVVEACLECDVRSMVYTSSASVLFSKSAPVPKPGEKPPLLLETAKPPPSEELNGAYPRAKAAAENFVLAANSHVLHVVVLRPGGLYGNKHAGLTKSVLAGQSVAGRPDASVPFVWVKDAARAHVDAVQQLVFPPPPPPPPQDTQQRRIHGRVFHLCHDPVRDPFLYGEFTGGPLTPAASAAKHETVRAAEAAAGVQEPPPCGTNAYGLRCNSVLPVGPIMFLSRINSWVGRTFGVALIDRSLTPENMLFCTRSWPCDVTEAREVLGWEPTPWRVVAARLGREAGGAHVGPSARAGKSKAE